MNKTVNKFLLSGDKFMPEMYLKEPGFTQSVCGPFTKTKKEFKNFKKQEIQTIFTKINLIKLVFNDIAYVDFTDLAKRTVSDKVLRDKAFSIAKSPKYDGYQTGLASMVYKFFDKKSAGSGVANNEIKQNLQLAEELHKPIIRNF